MLSFLVPRRSNHLLARTLPSGNFAPNAFLRITTDNTITIVLSKVEMGQGIWTTLPMLVAEELECDWSNIKVEHSPIGEEYKHVFIPTQATVGSSSTVSEFDRYRMAGATARAMLVQAASMHWGVPPASCYTEDGYVISGGKKISYGDVAMEAARLPVPSVRLKESRNWKYIGKTQKRLDGPEKINGTARFGIDVQFPDLLTAVVAHPPVFSGKVKSFDSSEAKMIQGVYGVFEIPSGIAVLGDTYWAAIQGRDALKIEWEHGRNEAIDSKLLFQEYRSLSRKKGKSAQQKGDPDIAFKRATKIIDVEYTVPYLAHAPLEPLNCTVRLSADKCEIWTGTQIPDADAKAVAKLLNVEPAQVEITTLFLGGGFGRRGSFDSEWIIEAVHIAKTSGQVIKLVWSREDDIKGGYYRPAYLHRAIIGFDKNRMPIAWQHRIVGQSVFEFFGRVTGIDESSVEGVMGSPYLESIHDHSVELHTTTVGVPILPWRSVGKSHTIFVMESLIDELAFHAGEDPVSYRQRLLKNYPRFLSVLNLAAKKAEWGKALPRGRFRGVAVSEGNGSYVSHVVEISLVKRRLRILRVVCAIDCGLAVNPDGVVAQMESCIVFGLTAALYGEITLEKGRVKQSNFHDYKLLRMDEMPAIEVHIVPGSEKMGGVGEPGVPGVAPALTNAIFAGTGKRIRSLPIRPEDLEG